MRTHCVSTSGRGSPGHALLLRVLLGVTALLIFPGCGGAAASPKSSGNYASDPSTVQVSGTAESTSTSADEEAGVPSPSTPAQAPPSPPAPGRMLAGKADTRFRSEVTRGGAAGSGALAQNAPQPGPQGGPGQPPGGNVQKKDKPRGTERSDVALQQAPMLIYTAQLTMAVFEVKKSIDAVEGLGRDLGGFLARRADQMIVIRVPAARFDEAIGRLEKMGDLLHRNVTAEDVTEEFTDMEVRLKSARAVRERLEQLLAKAQKVEESVMIERELERVAGEIERMEGRLKFLRDRAAYSTITVTFQPRRGETVGPDRFNLPVPWLHELGLRRLLTL